MESLISIQERPSGGQVVSAIELKEKLGILTRYDIWFSRLRNDFGFVEGVDFECLYKNVQMPNGGHKVTLCDFSITIGVAKEICMLQKNKIGRQFRRYLISCEEEYLKLKAQKPKELSRKEMALLIIAAEEEIEKLKPKAEYYEKVIASNSTFPVTIIAKELGLSATALNRELNKRGIIYKVNNVWVLGYKYQNMGYTKISTFTYTNDGESKTAHHLVWTEAGREFIHKLMSK